MREIKFRVWDKKTNKFIKGIVLNITKIFKDELDRYVFMQYTGFKDKNGVEIYEGDVVEVKYLDKAFDEYEDDKEYHFIGTVEFSDRGYLIKFKGGFRYLYQFSSEWYEVIGNVYDNKDLIKE